MRKLEIFGTLGIPSTEVLSVLRFRTIDRPLFPSLKMLDLSSVPGSFIPFIPLFLSSKTTAIDITFSASEAPKAVIASMVTTLPTLCPNLQIISLENLPRDPDITAAVSGMLLATNQNTLRSFHVDSPLTGEAHEAIYKLANLCELSTVIEKDTPLPPAVLPNLTNLTITYDGGDDWMQVFRGATLQKLESAIFYPQSTQIGDFLRAFARMALVISAQNALSELFLYTTCSWNPTYRSLLPFTQLKVLHIEFSCRGGCSSRVDDGIIIDLARAMPKLETLHLGDAPCRQIPIGVTAKGLVALANHCLDLSTLRIHFQVDSLSDKPAAAGIASNVGSIAPRRDCALTELDAGHIFVPEGSVLTVALTLARIFPCIETIYYSDDDDETWDEVEEAIRDSRQIVDCSGKEFPLAITRCNLNDISTGAILENGS